MIARPLLPPQGTLSISTDRFGRDACVHACLTACLAYRVFAPAQAHWFHGAQRAPLPPQPSSDRRAAGAADCYPFGVRWCPAHVRREPAIRRGSSRRHTMQVWSRWTVAGVATKQARTWVEWWAWQQRTLQEAPRDQRRRQDGIPFRERERARLAFVRWLHHTGRLGKAGDDTACMHSRMTPGSCLRSGAEKSRAALRPRAWQLVLALLLV